MRKLIMTLCLLLSSQSFAFENLAINNATDKLTNILSGQISTIQKARLLSEYKAFVKAQIDSIETPEDGLSMSDKDALEFASLLEFDEYLSNINIRNLTPERCDKAKIELKASSHGASQNSEKDQPAYFQANKVITALCQ